MDKKEYQIEWRKNNPKRFKELRERWIRNNPEKVKESRIKYKKKVYKREKDLKRIRQRTRRRFGSLKRGFEYHHFIPYKFDNIIPLEIKAHKFYHKFPKIGSANGKIIHIYETWKYNI